MINHWYVETLLREDTLQGTNISPKNGILKMIFLFPRWDMLIPWRVSQSLSIHESFQRQLTGAQRPNLQAAIPQEIFTLGYERVKMGMSAGWPSLPET